MQNPEPIGGQNPADRKPQESQLHLSKLIEKLDLRTIPPQQEPAAKISNVRHLASYDIRFTDNKPDPVIIVPG